MGLSSPFSRLIPMLHGEISMVHGSIPHSHKSTSHLIQWMLINPIQIDWLSELQVISICQFSARFCCFHNFRDVAATVSASRSNIHRHGAGPDQISQVKVSAVCPQCHGWWTHILYYGCLKVKGSKSVIWIWTNMGKRDETMFCCYFFASMSYPRKR